MQLFYPTIAVQLDFLSSALGVAAAIAISFAAITLVSSYLRFQQVVRQTDEQPPEELGISSGEVVRLQLARFQDGCARRRTSFAFSLIRFPGAEMDQHAPVFTAIQQAARNNDVTCVYDAETVGLLTEAEAEDVESILTRITEKIAQDPGCGLSGLCRVGIAVYPVHGLSGRELIQAALGGLEQATDEKPIVVPAVIEEGDAQEHDDETDEASGIETAEELDNEELDEEENLTFRERREQAMLDEVTQVLKPSAISNIMQRAMTEWRRNQQDISLFCFGINNIDNLVRLHGEESADTVMAAVSKVLRENLRSTDLIGRHERYGFLVLAQCPLEKASVVGKRIGALVQEAEIRLENRRLVTTLTPTVASYPEHGRNLHQLFIAAQKALDYNRENDIRAYAVYDPSIHDKMPSKPMKSIKAMKS